MPAKAPATGSTWKARAVPMPCAATPAANPLARMSRIFFAELPKLKQTPVIAKVRGEGMVFGIECGPVGDLSAEEVANEVVEAAYLGDGGDGIHLLGPLSGKVIRVSPPLTITEEEARTSLNLLQKICGQVAEKLQGVGAK